MAALGTKYFIYHVFRFNSVPASVSSRRLCSYLISDIRNFYKETQLDPYIIGAACSSFCSRQISRIKCKKHSSHSDFLRKLHTGTSSTCKMPFSIVERGTSNTTDYRIYFKNDATGAYVSPFHDIPLISTDSSGLYNMVVEIPRWTNHKMEISRDDPLNPIKQDIKKGKLRFVHNVFPHHGYIWNYGALPQTWENPEVKDDHTGFNGDNDPIDALEIGSRIAKRGEVLQVKALGLIALIDEGETDWKIVTINKKDPLFDVLKDINDVEKHLPGLLKATVEWLRMYKIPDGKPENQFAFNAEFKDKSFATKIIQETHVHWKNLVCRDEAKINLMNTSLNDGKNTIAVKEAEQIVDSTPPFAVGMPEDDSVGKWHFVQLK